MFLKVKVQIFISKKIQGSMAAKKMDALEECLEVEIEQLKSKILDLQTQVSDLKKDVSAIHDKFELKFFIMDRAANELSRAKYVSVHVCAHLISACSSLVHFCSSFIVCVHVRFI
ncbi:hypothetical protein KFK09_020688 [Dendrobium nobile]|uniref:Uncharacterized protein n=1 Tax=Dendrobium nobile TaxID=94219 RepID=A0A8T3AMY3_DENNO|nr:hypothetical protein KFK09_020688 [Dendrobium nobile]